MKPTTGDGENESRETQWPSVPKIASADEFRQCLAVARLAVKLCELQKRELQNKWEAEDKKYAHDIQTAVTESEKKRVNEERNKQMDLRIATLDPEGFLSRAWQLIESAGEHVSRPQTNAEYLEEKGGSDKAAEAVVRRIMKASRISFNRLCNPKPNQVNSKSIEIHGADGTINVDWKPYTTELAFDNLFWDYWNANSEIKDEGKRKQYGQSLLTSWKRDGVRPNDFLALRRFRRERNNRAENLKKKPKTKRRRLTAKARA